MNYCACQSNTKTNSRCSGQDGQDRFGAASPTVAMDLPCCSCNRHNLVMHKRAGSSSATMKHWRLAKNVPEHSGVCRQAQPLLLPPVCHRGYPIMHVKASAGNCLMLKIGMHCLRIAVQSAKCLHRYAVQNGANGLHTRPMYQCTNGKSPSARGMQKGADINQVKHLGLQPVQSPMCVAYVRTTPTTPL